MESRVEKRQKENDVATIVRRQWRARIVIWRELMKRRLGILLRDLR